MTSLSEQHIATHKMLCCVTSENRRAFQAQIVIDYVKLKPCMPEQTIDQAPKTVALELNKGIVCVDNFKARGNNFNNLLVIR